MITLDHPVLSPPAAAPGAPNAGVIREARRRRARRRARIGVGTLGTLALATVIYTLPPGRRHEPARGSHLAPAAVVLPSTVLARDPYKGVACPGAPNSIACDRIGLAVWLRRPAVSVDATIAGSSLKLDWAGDRAPRYATPGVKEAFDGFLQPAGLINHLHVKPDGTSGNWLGNDAPSPLVRLEIEYANGRTVVTQLPVPLAAGWG